MRYDTRLLIIKPVEWQRCLEEAITFHMSPQLRQLFAHICVFQIPSSGLRLWNLLGEHLCEDFLQSHPINIAHDMALRDISEVLKLTWLLTFFFQFTNFQL